MGKDLNKVMVIGRLGQDPVMRYTPNGTPVTNFSVAAGRQWNDPNGEKQEETEWFSIVAWNKLAEICNQHLTKGSRVYIEGRLQTRSWDDTETGAKRYKTEVVANDMIILDSKRGDADGGQGSSGGGRDYEAEATRLEVERAEQSPATPQRSARPSHMNAPPRPSVPRSVSAPIDDDDIPF